jgi:hypothetical protein
MGFTCVVRRAASSLLLAYKNSVVATRNSNQIPVGVFGHSGFRIYNLYRMKAPIWNSDLYQREDGRPDSPVQRSQLGMNRCRRIARVRAANEQSIGEQQTGRVERQRGTSRLSGLRTRLRPEAASDSGLFISKGGDLEFGFCTKEKTADLDSRIARPTRYELLPPDRASSRQRTSSRSASSRRVGSSAARHEPSLWPSVSS